MDSVGLQILTSSSMHVMEIAVVAGKEELDAFVEQGLGSRKLGLFVEDAVAVGMLAGDVVEGGEVCAMAGAEWELEVEQRAVERMVDMDCVGEVDSHAVGVVAAVAGRESGVFEIEDDDMTHDPSNVSADLLAEGFQVNYSLAHEYWRFHDAVIVATVAVVVDEIHVHSRSVHVRNIVDDA